MDLLDTLTLFGTVVLAAPIGLLGAEFVFEGRLITGGGFLFVAFALVAGGYLKPDLKGIVAETVVDVATEDPDDGRDEEAYKD
ncbi:MAG: DUF7533 family protein [Halobacteriota archaeon]|uniref:DUF7533 family protein n=1 Tax=Natronomonas sp. TaxID=2184060 RepID=UPI003977084D